MSTIFHVRPKADEFAAYYGRYIDQVPEGNIIETLAEGLSEASAMLVALPPEKASYRYAPDKWTVREVVAHVSDAERVFSYRALRFGRGDRMPLHGFDQDAWVPGSRARARSWGDLLDEFRVVRGATLHLFRSFAPEAWGAMGVASQFPVSVRALAWICAGHELHHRHVLAERYGLTSSPPARS